MFTIDYREDARAIDCAVGGLLFALKTRLGVGIDLFIVWANHLVGVTLVILLNSRQRV